MLSMSIKNNVIYINEVKNDFDAEDIENVILPIPTIDFEKLDVNSGSYGKIYKTIYNHQSYILKVFKNKQHSNLCLQEYNFISEVPYFGEVKIFNIADKPALLMREVPGLCLTDNKFQFLPILIKLEVWKAILEVASMLEKKNIVHLDLKPEHIFYDFETKKAYIIDFGSAKRNGEPFKNINTTFTYASHEFFLEESDLSVNSKMDSYSLGIIACELFGNLSTLEALKSLHFSHEAILADLESNREAGAALQYKLLEENGHSNYLAFLQKNARITLSNLENYSIYFNSLLELIDKALSPDINKRPTIETLFMHAAKSIKHIQSTQYATLTDQLSHIKINSSTQENYDKLWHINDSYGHNILKLLNDYLKQSKKLLTNRHHALEINELLNSDARYFPLILIEKIYDTISKKPDFKRNDNGSLLKRLAYIIKQLSLQVEFSARVITENNRNIEWKSNNTYIKHGDSSSILLSKPRLQHSSQPDAEPQNINLHSFH